MRTRRGAGRVVPGDTAYRLIPATNRFGPDRRVELRQRIPTGASPWRGSRRPQRSGFALKSALDVPILIKESCPRSPRMRLSRIAALLPALVLTTGAGPRAQGATFSFGASREDVRRVQGAPEVIERLADVDVEIWSWRSASVRFDRATGRVTGWDDPGRALRADLRVRGEATTGADLPLGATGADVVRLLGRPRQVRRTGPIDQWGYHGGVIAIGISDGRVAGWRDPERRLPMRRSQDDDAAVAFGGDAQARAGAHPRLLVRATLGDTSADGRRAGATNVLLVSIENAGPGTAYGVAPRVHVTRGLATVRDVAGGSVASLAAGNRVMRQVPVEFIDGGTDAVVEFAVGAGEANGAGQDAAIAVPVRLLPSLRPALSLERARVHDESGDGRLSPREIAEVDVLLRNAGDARTAGLWAQLSLGRDLHAVAGTPSRFALGPLAPGDTVRLRFSVYTLSRAESATVTLVVAGRDGRYPLRLPIPIRLERASFADAPGGAGQDGAVDIDADLPAAGPVNPQALAVVFGIDQYRSLPAARYAARDALAMRRHLVSLLGVPDDGDHLYLRADADATGAEFRKVFGPTGWLARRATPQSDIVIYYAGHGAAGANGDPLLLPWDADASYAAETGVSLSEIHESLARIPARRITIILDACFAGLTRGGAPLVPGSRPIVLSVEHPALLRDGMALLTAGQGAQAAGDLPAARHGLFSYWVMRGLRGEADADRDNRISIGELATFVTREVSRAAARQDREQRPLVITRDTSATVLRIPGRR